MTPLENLYYAIGELAYATARADGKVQKEERERFHDIVVAELGRKHDKIDISEIIFTLMDRRSDTDSATIYSWALNEIKQNGHYLSPDMKTKFIRVMERVAQAYPPVTVEERRIIEQFKQDIAGIKGDPIFYNQ